MTGFLRIALSLWIVLINAQAWGWVLNNPYPQSQSHQKIYYSSFSEQPKTLDPARSYSNNEYQFLWQIYEPPLQYDYLARPYKLIPLNATSVPELHFLDKNSQPLADSQQSEAVYSVYTIHIKPGIYYQPHPAFAKDKQGHYRYLQLPPDYLDEHGINTLADFNYTGTRELIADDYIYQIKRLANPAVNSSIFGLMSDHILGFREFSSSFLPEDSGGQFVDLRKYSMSGLRKLDDYSFEITLKGQYSQFLYWLAMPFFSPIPWEADQFYSQKEMGDKDLSFDWYPVGTGPFMLSENNPNRHMILRKNPNYRQEFFPAEGSDEDRKAGYLAHVGKTLPLIDAAIFTLEKESIPRWNKFLQGYYDLSAISNDSFDQAIKLSENGEPELTAAMQGKKIRLVQTIDPSIFYMGFNMLDPIVGGTSERARLLRLAISIAVNYDENIAIFYNGRGEAAQSPLPQGIFGYKAGEKGVNPYVYKWDGKAYVRRPIEDAHALMRQAGYPKGIDPKTGQPLLLYYDVAATGGPDDKSQLDWMIKQFAKIGIDLSVRSTQYNRFQEKMRSGNAQIFSWGWNADYPDPENFFFMLYGPNGKVKYGGENASNYYNRSFDRLFEDMKNLPNGEQRQQLIDTMIEIVRHDAPWAFGINSESLVLSQQWVSPMKTSSFSSNTLKYLAIDVDQRNALRKAWNQPILWPLGLLMLLILIMALLLFVAYRHKEQQKAARMQTC